MLTKKFLFSLPFRSIGRLWYHWPQYLTHSSIVLVWHSWHCTKLVQILIDFPLAVFVSNAIMISPPHILASSMVSPKAQFLALCSLSSG